MIEQIKYANEIFDRVQDQLAIPGWMAARAAGGEAKALKKLDIYLEKSGYVCYVDNLNSIWKYKETQNGRSNKSSST